MLSSSLVAGYIPLDNLFKFPGMKYFDFAALYFNNAFIAKVG